MTIIAGLDDFVDWGNAVGHTSSTSEAPNVHITSDVTTPPRLPQSPRQSTTNFDSNFDLVLENVNGDEFSFWALEHFSSHGGQLGAIQGAVNPSNSLSGAASRSSDGNGHVSLLQTSPEPAASSMDVWEMPETPCDHCQRGAYQCKKIEEGKYKGYCTSCVALRCQCSFGLAQDSSSGPSGPSATFPVNPWPTLGDHPDPIILYELNQDLARLKNVSTLDLPSPVAASAPVSDTHATAAGQPKIGARFSRECVKVLKNWLSTHSRHPYPTDDEKEALVRRTGLSKVQIANWLANARRRGKIQAPRSTSPHVRSSLGAASAVAGAIDIPVRRATPCPLEDMNPLQRWVESPPDHEPASVTDIARAINTSSSTASSGLSSPYGLNMTDDSSGRSLCNWSSASSLGTSHSSNNSFASAYSHGSLGSLESISSFNRGRRRRRRRQAPQPAKDDMSLTAPQKTYQCTFCTLTFRTKHDWQRHEKSLHLSLERWVCAPDGPSAINPSTGQACCVFCGEPNPGDDHMHNYCSCQERSLDERTFYRKDHLRQHLKLVHNAKFVAWSMEPWKVATPEIRSRCGFCGIVMDSWTFRVDHLAEHFKTGYSMADWKGDWGFEAPVLQMVENSIPPYLIHAKRNSPLPRSTNMMPPESPRNAYELIKIELSHYASVHLQDTRRAMTDAELQHEACRIIFAAEARARGYVSSAPSWLRDLIMSSPQVSESARLSKMRSADENRFSQLQINGKTNIFDDCTLEQQLHEFVRAKDMLGRTTMDRELQEEACRIIGRQEEMSNNPVDDVANWLVRLICSSQEWLAPFRHRASLPRSEDMDENLRSKDPVIIDSMIYNYSRLDVELAEYVKQQRSMGTEPTDADLQRQSRIIIYEFDDAWNQTAADNEQWLAAFRRRHVNNKPIASSFDSPVLSSPVRGFEQALQQTPSAFASLHPNTMNSCPTQVSTKLQRSCYQQTGQFLTNHMNYHGWLETELSRWVKSLINPNNPNRHIPMDSEIQHKARWILYDDDDPRNKTAADDAEWLRRFKRNVGLLTNDGAVLPQKDAWSTCFGGGSGLAPPSVPPNCSSVVAPYQANNKVSVSIVEGTKPAEAKVKTANKFPETFLTCFLPRPKVSCPRELESGLLEYVQGEAVMSGRFPTDEELKERARLILGKEHTPADNQVMLEAFKRMARTQAARHGSEPDVGGAAFAGGRARQQPADSVANAAADHAVVGLKSGLRDLMTSSGFEHQQHQQMQTRRNSDAEEVRVNMTETELDEMLKDLQGAVAADVCGPASLGLDE